MDVNDFDCLMDTASDICKVLNVETLTVDQALDIIKSLKNLINTNNEIEELRYK